jgi:hypothetical protein
VLRLRDHVGIVVQPVIRRRECIHEAGIAGHECERVAIGLRGIGPAILIAFTVRAQRECRGALRVGRSRSLERGAGRNAQRALFTLRAFVIDARLMRIFDCVGACGRGLHRR